MTTVMEIRLLSRKGIVESHLVNKKTAIYSCLSLFLLLIVFMCLRHRYTETLPQRSLPVWRSSGFSPSDLGPESCFQGYGMQIPIGYEAKYSQSLGMLQPFGLGMYLWLNDNQLPNASGLTVNIIHRLNADTPGDVVNAEMALNKKDMESFACSEIERGKINGKVFAPAYWQGVNKTATGLHITRGFTYACMGTTGGVTITGDDKVPCASEPCEYQPIGQPVLPRLEAAVLTLHQSR